tara:strand:+ start:588 stop:716 length:129 start_codon:yes stop_codon:yes gene_type:complete
MYEKRKNNIFSKMEEHNIMEKESIIVDLPSVTWGGTPFTSTL